MAKRPAPPIPAGMSLAQTPVIALHGFTGRGSDWGALRDRLRGRAWITPDLPGHGPGFDEGDAADLEANLRAVRRARAFFSEPPVLLAYSMGARLALHAALAMPRAWSALVLIGGSPGLESEANRAARVDADDRLAERILGTDTESFLNEWDTTPLLAGRAEMPEPWKSRSLEARRQNTPAGLAASLRGVGTGALEPLHARLKDIPLATLVLAGERDEKFVGIGRAMEEALPYGTFATVPGVGHAAHLESPEATAAMIDAWMKITPAPEYDAEDEGDDAY